MGEQLNHTNAEIVYLDFSNASSDITKERARYRRLKNIVWIRGWIEDVRYYGAGFFHNSECSGVLHHLKDPLFGLKILKDSLHINGGMLLMVYAKTGRTSIYMLQTLFQEIKAVYEMKLTEEVDNAKHVLHIIPAKHWFFQKPILLNDYLRGDAGIYDLLLHKRDVAFSTYTMLQWISIAGFHFVAFESAERVYHSEIKSVVNDIELAQGLRYKPRWKQWSIAEYFFGSNFKHSFYVSKEMSSEAKLSKARNRMYIYGNPYGLREALSNRKNQKNLGSIKWFSAKISETYRVKEIGRSYKSFLNWTTRKRANAIPFNFEINDFSLFVMDHLMKEYKGIRIKSLYSKFRKKHNSSLLDRELYRIVENFFNNVKKSGMVLLQSRHVSYFPKRSSISLFDII